MSAPSPFCHLVSVRLCVWLSLWCLYFLSFLCCKYSQFQYIIHPPSRPHLRPRPRPKNKRPSFLRLNHPVGCSTGIGQSRETFVLHPSHSFNSTPRHCTALQLGRQTQTLDNERPKRVHGPVQTRDKRKGRREFAISTIHSLLRNSIDHFVCCGVQTESDE